MNSKRIVIIGGGIGGLTAGIALSRDGHDVMVTERAPALLPVGSGLLLSGKALDAFADLDILSTVQSRGSVVEQAELRDWQGNTMAESWSETFNSPEVRSAPVCIHRAVLHEVLLDTLGEQRLLLGSELVGFEEDGEQVVAQFGNGSSMICDLLVGADGIRSTVRSQLWPAVAPRYDGQTMYRGVYRSAAPALGGVACVAFGKGTRFGWLPLGDDAWYWFAGQFQAEGIPDHEAGRTADLKRTFGTWASPVPEMIEGTDPESILRSDVYTIAPFAPWGSGRITLLGDAAHAVSPHLGQGACQAIEDANALASSLREHQDPRDGLRHYEDHRAAEVHPLFDKAGSMAERFIADDPLAIRDYVATSTRH